MIIMINGFFIYYLLSLLLLDNGGIGPKIPFLRRQIFDARHEEAYSWDATIVDCLRRVLFMYECRVTSEENSDKTEIVWYLKDNQMTHMWSCPLCLGFWLAVMTATLNIFSNQILNILSDPILNIFANLILNIIASAGAGVFLYKIAGKEFS